MYSTYSQRQDLKVLLIDEGALSRSVMATMLRELGITQITQVTHPMVARKYLADNPSKYDLIVCDYHFEPHGKIRMTGQDLLEELRQSRGLPMSTAFIMVTDEARYQYVADSIEGALDDYLLKPFSITHFEKRLDVVLSRKKSLSRVFDAIEQEDYETAARLCEHLLSHDPKHKLYAARIGTELYLRLDKHDNANSMFNAVLKHKALPWAKLGIAKIQLDSSQNPAQASRSLEALIQECPKYADAYDVLGRAKIELLDFEAAFKTYESAVKLTPGSLSRLQKLGTLAVILGNTSVAKKSLESALAIGSSAKALDFNTFFLLALLGYDTKEHRAWDRYKKRIEYTLAKYPSSYRLKAIHTGISAVEYLAEKKYAQMDELLTSIAQDIREPQFDFEMACNLLHLLVRARSHTSINPLQVENWISQLASRFCVSKPSTKIMAYVSSSCEEFTAIVNSNFDAIGAKSREALSLAIAKNFDGSLQCLLDYCTQTLNSRLFALTRAALERYSGSLTPAVKQDMSEKLTALQQTYNAQGTHARSEVKFRTPVPKTDLPAFLDGSQKSKSVDSPMAESVPSV